MKIAQREDFSLILMRELAKSYSEKYLSLTTAAAKTKLSPLFLKHIASALLRKGLIESKEGVDGGYRLARPPKSISIAEIVESKEGGIISPSCVQGDCRFKSQNICGCNGLWKNVNGVVYDYLKKINLSDFALLK